MSGSLHAGWSLANLCSSRGQIESVPPRCSRPSQRIRNARRPSAQNREIETGGQKRHKRFLGNIKPAGAGLIGIAVYLYLTDRTLLISSQLTFPALLSRLRSM